MFRDIAAGLVPVAAGARRREGEALTRLLDATPIPLKGNGFPWAEVNARTRGLKLHRLFDPRHSWPVGFEVTSATVDDVVAGRAIPLEAEATCVFDKGYPDDRWWAAILAAGAIFITRRKRNAHRHPLAQRGAAQPALSGQLARGRRRPGGS